MKHHVWGILLVAFGSSLAVACSGSSGDDTSGSSNDAGSSGNLSGDGGAGNDAASRDASSGDAGTHVDAGPSSLVQQAYVKASNSLGNTGFGGAVAMSADGNTIAVGADYEMSDAIGIDGSQSDTSFSGAGAVYVFSRSAGTWTQTAYVKASNTSGDDYFGSSIALSSDGTTMAVGASGESSGSSGVGGSQDQSTNFVDSSGAVYVFQKSAGAWAQTSYIKASNPNEMAFFGGTVALSSDGTLLAVGSTGEASNGSGQSNTSDANAGAVYLFAKGTTTWAQTAYLKASNPHTLNYFGTAIALTGDGTSLAVGSWGEPSAAQGIDSANQSDTSADDAGAVYLFTKNGATWTQSHYLKASNNAENFVFGSSVSFSNDGTLLAVGAPNEPSGSPGINGSQTDTSKDDSGAVYLFAKAASTWTQIDYVKASTPSENAAFGTFAAFSGDGKSLLVGARLEDGISTGINGDETNTTGAFEGAAYLFSSASGSWKQLDYIKASNTSATVQALFGTMGAISNDGTTFAIGAPSDASDAKGINGNQTDTSAAESGALYIFN